MNGVHEVASSNLVTPMKFYRESAGTSLIIRCSGIFLLRVINFILFQNKQELSIKRKLDILAKSEVFQGK